MIRIIRSITLAFALLMVPISAAHAEDEILLNNLMRATQPEREAIAKKQGEFLRDLSQGLLTSLLSVVPTVRFGDGPGKEVGVANPEIVAEFTAISIGNSWAKKAERMIEERQREVLRQEIPDIKAQIAANTAARKAEAEVRARKAEEEARRAQVYGPPRPSAWF